MSDEERAEEDNRVLKELRQLREDLSGEEDLVSIKPPEAVDLWLDQLTERRESTIQSYEGRVSHFLDFLDEEGINDLSEVTTREIKQYEAERRDGDRGPQTLNNQLGTLRLFLRYCKELKAVPEDVVEAVNVPELTKDDRVNTEKLISERASTILRNLDRYRYASRDHVLMLLLWRTTVRIGAIHSLDLEDLYLDDDDRDRLRTQLRDKGLERDVVDEIVEDVELPVVYPRHRPETGTPLKNGASGERVINVAESTAEVLQDFIRVNRTDLEDDHGRRPLLTSERGGGRLSSAAMRNRVYILTQPCEFGDPCPYGEEKENCEAREHGYASRCPGARSPHKIRTGSITWHRDRGWPIADLADRANTSEELVRSVYDQPEELVRGSVRREYLENLDDDQNHE